MNKHTNAHVAGQSIQTAKSKRLCNTNNNCNVKLKCGNAIANVVSVSTKCAVGRQWTMLENSIVCSQCNGYDIRMFCRNAHCVSNVNNIFSLSAWDKRVHSHMMLIAFAIYSKQCLTSIFNFTDITKFNISVIDTLSIITFHVP